jgi:hypothetical protein
MGSDTARLRAVTEKKIQEAPDTRAEIVRLFENEPCVSTQIKILQLAIRENREGLEELLNVAIHNRSIYMHHLARTALTRINKEKEEKKGKEEKSN